MVKTVLRVEHVHHSPVDWLHYNYTCVEICLLVGVPYDPIYKCSEKVSFSELNDLGRILIGLGRLSV